MASERGETPVLRIAYQELKQRSLKFQNSCSRTAFKGKQAKTREVLSKQGCGSRDESPGKESDGSKLPRNSSGGILQIVPPLAPPSGSVGPRGGRGRGRTASSGHRTKTTPSDEGGPTFAPISSLTGEERRLYEEQQRKPATRERTSRSNCLEVAHSRRGSSVEGGACPGPDSNEGRRRRQRSLSGGATRQSEGDELWMEFCLHDGKVERVMALWQVGEGLDKVAQICHKLERLCEQLVLGRLELASSKQVCAKLWKGAHYPVLECLRRACQDRPQDAEVSGQLEHWMERAELFYSTMLEAVQKQQEFSLRTLLSGSGGTAARELYSKAQLRKVMLAVPTCYACCLALGDISRYGQQLQSQPDWAKPRSFYLKAQLLAPKDGRPYNQLAVIAISAHRRLDAVYYYMRSLSARNRFLSAHDSLVGLFEETSRKAQRSKVTSRSKVARKKVSRRRHSAKEGVSPGRREVWIMPGVSPEAGDKGGVACDYDDDDSGNKDGSTSEIPKKLVSSFLLLHGKLFTKIGVEGFVSSVGQFILLLRRSLEAAAAAAAVGEEEEEGGGGGQAASHLLKMAVINIFSIHNAHESFHESESGRRLYCSLGFSLGVEFGSTLLNWCSSACGDDEGACPSPLPRPLLCRLGVALPAVRVWLQWMASQRVLWAPLTTDPPETLGNFWSVLCSFLNHVTSLCPALLAPEATPPQPRPWEDRLLAGFTPLSHAPSMLEALAIRDRPALTEQDHSEQCVVRLVEVVRVVRALCDDEGEGQAVGVTFDPSSHTFHPPVSVSLPSSATPPAAAREEEGAGLGWSSSGSSSEDDVMILEEDGRSSSEGEGPAEIRELKVKKEQLTKQIAEQNLALETAKSVLSEAASRAEEEMLVTPRYLVPDTNCFVDQLAAIKSLALSGSFTIAIPLIVLAELEGLASDASLDSAQQTRSLRVSNGARLALDYISEQFACKSVAVRALTTQGSLLATLSFRAETTSAKASNDDHILQSCVKLHAAVDSRGTGKRRCSVVLLTDDRNLRVKAHASTLPVKDMPDFMKLTTTTT